MCYDVQCSACSLSGMYEDLDTIFDLQERHKQQHGEHHILEFERCASADGGDDRSDG